MRCPHCGAAVPRRAKACPECGSDENTGWRPEDEIDYESIDLPEPYDPDAFEKEGAARESSRTARAVIVILLVLGLLAFCLCL